MIKNLKKHIFNIVAGSIVGLLFPTAFILLDLNQLGESFTLKSILFVIDSQYIYTFSVYIFPIVFSVIAILFSKVLDGNKELLAANEKIKEEKKKAVMNDKLASLGVLAAGIGHEINNPLMILQTSAFSIGKKLKKNGFENIKVDEKLQLIKMMVQRIAKIVNGLQVLARMDDSKEEIVDVNKIIKLTTGTLENIFRQESVEINYELTTDNVLINGNLGKLQQIILNLVSNAKDAILEDKLAGTIVVETINYAGKVIIHISDNGSGIKKANLEKIFDTFFTTKSFGKGTGMGLSIVHSLVQELKAEISVSSEVGVGTKFSVTIDEDTTHLQATQHENTKKINMSSTVQDDLSGRVLIVEDERSIRNYLGDLLSSYGLNVDQVEDGLQAYNKQKTKDYDVILTDLKMPHMSGEELIKKVINEDKKDTPFIVLTGGNITEFDESEHDLIKTLSACYIRKPFEESDIYDALSAILSTSDAKDIE